jgi:hypothetical protein
MKQLKNQHVKPLSATEMKNLCVETKETMVTQNQLKKFSVVDLWSIQKNRKVTILRSAMVL